MPFESEIALAPEVMGIVSTVVGLVFGYAALSKLIDVRSLVAGIREFQVVRDSMVPVTAGTLIVAEVVISLSHLTGTGLAFIAPGTVLVLLIFMGTTTVLLNRKEKLPCLCFGASTKGEIGIDSLVRIFLLLLAELAICIYTFVPILPVVDVAMNAYDRVELLANAALVVILINWCISAPKLHRTWLLIMRS